MRLILLITSSEPKKINLISMEQTMTVSIGAKKENSQVIKFSGEFDKAGLSAVKGELNAAVKAFDGTHLVFDFGGLKFINSEGIGYLMELHGHLNKSDKKLAIAKPNAHVKDVFNAVGIGDVIPVCASVDACLSK